MKKFLAIIVMASIFVTMFSSVAMANTTDSLAGDFADIKSHWAYEEISQLIAAGIVKGYSTKVWDDTTGQMVDAKLAKPNQKITRAEFAVILYQALNLNAESESAPFSDDIPNWALTAINSLYKQGIIKGNPDGTFKANSYITRAEIVTMLVQALHDKSEQVGPTFPDVEGTYWASSFIGKAAAMGIVSGFPSGDFGPRQNAQRGEVMVMLYKFMTMDKSQTSEDAAILEPTDRFLKLMEDGINSNNSVDLSSANSYVTGEMQVVLQDGQNVLNELKQNGTLTYKVTYPGQVIQKSDWLAEVVYETQATFKAIDSDPIDEVSKEHYYLMKIGDKWYIYSSYEE